MKRDFKIPLIIAIASALLFVPFIGRLHLFDWDEINFAESAREMLLTKDYLTVQIFFEPFWEKPPLFIWFQALSMHVFGMNEFAARFPNSIAGIVTLLVLYFQGKKLVDEKFGVIWVLTFGASMLPFFYFKSGIIDPWFNLFIFLAIINYVYAQREFINKRKYFNLSLAAIFLGLAVLTKGPVAILVFGLTVFILFIGEKFKLYLRFGHVLTFIALVAFVGGFWFLLQIFSGNWQTVVDFFEYQLRLFREKDAGHGGFPFYHFIILFFGVFPASVFAIHAHRKNKLFDDTTAYFRRSMIILLWVVLILFSIVQTKIVHYSSLCYFPISFLAGYSVYGFISKKQIVPKWVAIMQISTASLLGLLIRGFPIFDKYKQWFVDTGKITQAFLVGNLNANPGWSGFEPLIGILLISGTVVSIILIRRGNILKGFKIQAITSVLFIFLAITFLAPGIEKYSQNSAIKFFKSISGKDVYVQTFYKSYAMLYYTNAMPPNDTTTFNINWLLEGDIDKDAWFVMRADKKESNISLFKNLNFVYEENGYVFCIRKKKLNNTNE